ncbi:malto-oligosyltrehalose synthase [Nakamurella endophytica]|uniref:Malto-oligosyltrehalose synthase n=1 Tax=Nakamurella endophytica TaxID=1748367 RepID=A0A917WCI9_9ACTN|nr:malto-oligosyltrehalose synthase [Nakamurella endophytica]GGL92872.1 malto-oligosyltrehalose synthase [Nakamurella endophytica]
MRLPVSTYRLQVTAEDDLEHAAGLVPYLSALGADWVYLSPILASEPGSTHGYDVIDHGTTDEPRGGREGLRAVADAAHGAGLGVLVDIVPNHVGVATPKHSLWWWDVLQHGRESAHADAFDVDWAAGGGKILLPVLGDGGDAELDQLEVVDGELAYYDHRYPVAPGTEGGSGREVHERQHYRLVNWRRADNELNYRRFFAVNDLAAVRVERPDVFASSHSEVAHWFHEGWVDGLRVDHPDGLFDPGQYLERLSDLTGGAYLLVEKILEPGEELPVAWPCHGTTGYDALAVLDRLFVDPAGQAPLDRLETELRGGTPVDWPAMIASTKRGIADGILHAEVLRLTRLVTQGPDALEPPAELVADTLGELLARFPVYRSYLPVGRAHLDQAAAAVRLHRPELAPVLDVLLPRLTDPDTEVATRFQQTSGMVMAKGVEDTAFYRWSRLTSLNEVGADPSVWAVTPRRFHDAQLERLGAWPHAMTTMSTHDTKRGEDVRARISVLSELPDLWAAAVRRWAVRTPLSDRPLANLLFQAVVGAWPISRERMHAYAEKASREAGVSTAWTDSDTAFEETMHALVDAVYDDPVLHQDLVGVVERLAAPGWSNSLTAKLLQLTGPGVPDVYQGSERWETSLVDPDNRRPVDHRAAAELLERIDGGWRPEVDESGAAKLLVVSRALRLRRDRPELFTGYRPLTADGPAAQHLVGVDRGGVLAVGTRLPVGLAERGGWVGTTLTLPPGAWQDQLGEDPAAPALRGVVAVGDLLARYPVALLTRTEDR